MQIRHESIAEKTERSSYLKGKTVATVFVIFNLLLTLTVRAAVSADIDLGGGQS